MVSAMNLNEIIKGDSVIVRTNCVGRESEFQARVDYIYPTSHEKSGMLIVVDQDDDAFDVTAEEIVSIADADSESEDGDDEHDQFRHDGEADGDALASAGMGNDEDYEHGTPDDGPGSDW